MSNTIIGINPSDVLVTTSTAFFRLGTKAGYDDPNYGYKEFIYGRAAGAITGLGYVCVETTGFDFAMVTVTLTTAGTAGHGSRLAAAQAAMADNEYGWFQIYGRGSVRCGGPAAIGTRLNDTAAAGELDDNALSGSEVMNGIVLLTAAGAQATVTDAMLNYPDVGATI